MFVLLLAASGGLKAQLIDIDAVETTDIVGTFTEDEPFDGKFVEGEAIIAFESRQSSYQKRTIERTLLWTRDMIVKEWSPSGKYALLQAFSVNRKTCGYDGDGNPYGVGPGGGDAGLNYVTGTDDYFDDLDCDRVQINNVDDGILISADYSDYSPTSNCQAADQIVPNWSPLPLNNVRVAIIDSGIKGIGGFGQVNGVSVSQKVVPLSCRSSVCGSYSPSLTEAADFNSHGRSIASLITGWFRALNLDSKLRINSYKVLNNNLQGSVFQVIKAIEEATADGNHIISLSLGFKAQDCGDGATLIPDFPNLPGTRTFFRKSPLYYAIKDAEQAGVIVVTSAGNDGNDLDVRPQYPAAEAGLHNLVTVGALTCGGFKPTVFSNYSNEHVDLFTSGDRIPIIDGLCTREVSGTSFACPIVSAKAALHVTMLGGNNYMEVLCRLRGESRPHSDALYGVVDTGAPFQSDCNRTDYSKGLEKSFAGSSGKKIGEVAISPNPFQDRLRVDVPEAEALLTITDARGVSVMQKEVHQASTTLDLGQLKPGVYWVSVHSATGAQTKSIVKQ